jgi:hypothetical protein
VTHLRPSLVEGLSVRRRTILTSLETRFRELVELSHDPAAWVSDPTGANLWLDGLTAFRETSAEEFLSLATAFSSEWSDGIDRDASFELLPVMLDQWDQLIDGVPRGSFWPVLAIGMTLVEVLGGVPAVHEGETAVVNDTLLVLLSKRYRSVRFAAYNRGARFETFSRLPRAPFVPEAGFFAITPPYVVRDMSPERVQQYTVNHDLTHIVLFGDSYRLPTGSCSSTSALLLNAEETCLGIEPLLIADLSRFGVPLHHLDEYETVQNGWLEDEQVCPESVFGEVRQNAGRAGVFASAVQSRAQRFLRDATPIAASRRSPEPPNLGQWLSDSALRGHAKWNQTKAVLLERPGYRDLVSLLPTEPAATANLHRYARASLAEDWPLDVETPSVRDRETGLLKNACKLLLVRLGELRANFDEGFTHGLPPSIDCEAVAMDIAHFVTSLSSGHVTPVASEHRELFDELLQRASALVEQAGQGDRETAILSLRTPEIAVPMTRNEKKPDGVHELVGEA